jgi:LmbE family N-acetylglucosaminyl deacetylase
VPRPRVSTLVVSTHLDDAVLSCYHALEPETTVVTVLAGVPPPGEPGRWDRDNGVADSAARVRARLEEDREALALSGSRVVHLDLLDSQYADVPSPSEIAALLAPILTPAARVLAPAGIRNLDHKAVRDAVLLVRPDAILYADLPYALHPDYGGFALPEEIAGREAEQVEVALSDAKLAQKLAAVRCYRTQIDQLVAHFGDFVDEAGLGREVHWGPIVGGRSRGYARPKR